MHKQFTEFITTPKTSIHSHLRPEKESTWTREIDAYFYPENDPSNRQSFIFILKELRLSRDRKFIRETVYRKKGTSEKKVGVAYTEITTQQKLNLLNQHLTKDLVEDYFEKKKIPGLRLRLLKNYTD